LKYQIFLIHIDILKLAELRTDCIVRGWKWV